MSTEDHQFSPDQIFPLFPTEGDIPANADIPPHEIVDQLQKQPPKPFSSNTNAALISPNGATPAPLEAAPSRPIPPWRAFRSRMGPRTRGWK